MVTIGDHSDTKYAEVRNPATDEVIGKRPIEPLSAVDAAVAAARAAQPGWAKLGETERIALLLQVADRIDAAKDRLAEWIVNEQGKPMAGAGAPVEVKASSRWIRDICKIEIPVERMEDDDNRFEVHLGPLGVIAAVVPWNWPVAITAWSIAPALRMGNTIVLKPSEYTTLCTLELFRMFKEVLPEGVVQVVCGAGDIGARLVAHEDIDKVIFTGSCKTGKAIAGVAAKRLASVTLELGGNDAAIVLPGSKAEKIAMSLFWGAFLNNGQTCISIKRLYVHSSIYDEFVDALAHIARSMPRGYGMKDGVVMGPLQNTMQLNFVSSLVDDARAGGARIVTGGEKCPPPGLFYPATIVADIDNHARLVMEEQFGPALPIIKYEDVDHAVRMANALDVGLGASVWGEDVTECEKIAHRLEAGTVWVNIHGVLSPVAPFFGIKQSGMGVEFGVDGLKSCARMKVISFTKEAV